MNKYWYLVLMTVEILFSVGILVFWGWPIFLHMVDVVKVYWGWA